MKIDEILNDNAKGIFNNYKHFFPLRIVEFINELGITIISSELPQNISGGIRKEEEKYIIYVNNLHTPNKKRFTLAHELGHYLYDKEYLCNSEIIDRSKQAKTIWYRRTASNIINQEMTEMCNKANQFAFELLMPEEKFIEIWQKYNTPEKVSKYFKVSIDATKIRASILLGEIF